MKFIQTEQHVHKFSKKATKTSLLYKNTGDNSGASVSGKDTLLLRICVEKLPNGAVCKATQAYDLERTKT